MKTPHTLPLTLPLCLLCLGCLFSSDDLSSPQDDSRPRRNTTSSTNTSTTPGPPLSDIPRHIPIPPLRLDQQHTAAFTLRAGPLGATLHKLYTSPRHYPLLQQQDGQQRPYDPQQPITLQPHQPLRLATIITLDDPSTQLDPNNAHVFCASIEGQPRDLCIPFSFRGLRPQLYTNPPRLNFGQLLATQSATRHLCIRSDVDSLNQVDPLTLIIKQDTRQLHRWRISSPALTPQIPHPRQGDATFFLSTDLPCDPLAALSFPLSITYTSPDGLPDQSSLSINALHSTTDSALTLPLLANTDLPCLDIQPSPLRTTAVVASNSTLHPVTLSNCGSTPLQILTAPTLDTPPQTFSLETLPRTFPLTLQPQQSQDLTLRFTPHVLAPPLVRAQLNIETDLRLQPTRSLALFGQILPNACPTAQISATIDDKPQTWTDYLSAHTDQTITLSALNSQNPDGGTLHYQWSRISSPPDDDSLAQQLTAETATQPEIELRFEQSGLHILELDLRDRHGVQACQTDRITLDILKRP